MTFKVQELTIKVTAVDDYDTCSGVTKPTGCVNASIFGQAGAASRNLSVLKGQLRKAMTQA